MMKKEMNAEKTKGRFYIPAFWRGLIVIALAYLVFDNAFPPLMPMTLMIQFMIITVVGVLLYFSFDEHTWAEFRSPVLAVLREDRLKPVLWLFLIALPVLAAYVSYLMVKPSGQAPVELRQVHPAPPANVKVFGNRYDLATLENPKRLAVLEKLKTDKEGAWKDYSEIVGKGRDQYYQNCYFCHGDLLDGTGPFAQGFSPLPINFQDVGTIAQLQEAFLFWRITTGGSGLPKEGTPWNSAMPVWHEMLSEDSVWEIITFLYDYVGQVPRIWDAEVSKAVTGMKDELAAQRKGMMGKELYQFRCQVCHGEEGAGDGPGADFMYPRPRDFTLGLFKYKTSPGTLPPRDEDLANTIKHGLPGTSMPGWASQLSEEQVQSLIPVLKGFDIAGTWPPEGAAEDAFDESGRYKGTDFKKISEQEPTQGQVAYSDESVQKGKAAFDKACKECHGSAGRGNITSGKKLADDWGFRLWPRDLTKPWTWRATQMRGEDIDRQRDDTVRAIYTRLSIGIPGTPMPAHRALQEGNADPVSLEDRWHIANFVYSLRDTSIPPTDTGLIVGAPVEGALPTSPEDKAWDTVPGTTLNLVPNIIKEERLFKPLNDAVTVRVLYNQDEIAFLLDVDDRTHSLPGDQYFTDLMDESLTMSPDAFAIELPKEGAFETMPVVTKPLFRHGDKAKPVSIWYWNAGSLAPAVPAKAMVLDGIGPDQKLKPRADASGVTAEGKWLDGRWRVLMKRSRQSQGDDVHFDEGRFIPVAFANWDGSNGEAGSKHTLTSWYWLNLPKEVDIAKVYGLPALVGFLVFLAGLGLARSQKKGVANQSS